MSILQIFYKLMALFIDMTLENWYFNTFQAGLIRIQINHEINHENAE